MNNPDNLLGVLATILHNRKKLIRLALVVGIGSAAISLFLPTYYASTATFYPASPQLASPELLFGNTAQVTEYYGSETDLDRMLTIAESNEVVDFMIKKYRLYEHYAIDSTTKKAPFNVRQRFADLYKVTKTRADAIQLTVEDTDPEWAAAMVNSAMAKINDIASRLTRESQAQLLSAFETSMTEKQILLKTYGDSLKILRRESGIIDATSQGEMLAEMVGKSESEVTKGRIRLEELEKNPLIPRDTIAYIRANLKAVEKEYFDLTDEHSVKSMNVKRFNEGLSKVQEIQDLHFQGRKQLSYDVERFNQIRAAYRTNFPSLHVVESGEVPVVKSRPTRSIIVLAATLAALIFAILAMLVAENYRNVNWKELAE